MTTLEALDERQLLIRGRLAERTMILIFCMVFVNAWVVGWGLDWASPGDQAALLMVLAFGYFDIRAAWSHALIGVHKSPMARFGLVVVVGLLSTVEIANAVAEGSYSFWSHGRAGEQFSWTLALAFVLATSGAYLVRCALDRREASR